MGYKYILVTLDGSKLSELALQQAVRIAEPNAQIHLLSVISQEGPTTEVAALASAQSYLPTQPEAQWPHVKGHDPREVNARKKYLDEVSAWLQPIGYSVEVQALQGDVIETILDVAARGFEVIVMATHARSGVSKTVLGSVTEAVLREARCPLLIVTPNTLSKD